MAIQDVYTQASATMLVLCGLAGSLSAAEGRFDPQERAGRHAIEVDKPAQHFFEGGVLGNGGLGAIVCTRPDAVVVYLGHNDVWDIRIAEENKGKLVKFEELWERLKRNTPEDQKWYAEYCKIARENYAKEYPRPWPCGSVLFGFDRRRAEVLGHRVRIDTGVCEVAFLVEGEPATLEIFTDMKADRVWMRMLDAKHRPIPSPFHRVRLIPENGMARTTSSADDTLSFRQVLPVLGAVREKDKAIRTSVRVSGKIEPRIEAASPFVACVDLEHGLAKDVAEKASAPPATAEAYEGVASRSAAVWKDYWSRSGVQLGDEFLERIWYRNLYFLNCSVRPGVTCPGLFANWSYKNIGTAWHGDYHTNYNLQQPFWVTFSANQVEKHLPYVDLVHFLLPVSRQWAQWHYELPGAFFPHSAYPVEMTMMPYPVPTWGGEVCETPWVVQSLWWHYRYTMDKTFLRARAFGPIREAVQFLNGYMRRPDGRGPQWGDDCYHIYPTVAPELHGLKADPKMNADCNVDLTLAKFVFKAYLQACAVLAVESQEAALMADVKDILAHFPPYPTAQSRLGKVFVSVPGESPEQVYNTPNSLMAVFPGEDIGIDSPREQVDIALNTWRNQQNEGGNDLVFLNLQGARLGALDLDRFKRQINYCVLPNGTCTDMVLQTGGRYNDDTPYDFMRHMGIWFENFALPVVVNESLMQSYTGRIRVFPNWYADKPASFQDLRAVGAFLVSAEFAGGRVRWIRVRSEAGGRLTLFNPWQGAAMVTRGATTSTLAGRLLELDTQPGDVVTFRPGEGR